MSEGFMMDAWTGMLFFRFCMRHNVHDLKDRTCLMREIVRRKKAKYLRDIGPTVAGKKVLQVGFKPHNNGPEHTCPDCAPKEKP